MAWSVKTDDLKRWALYCAAGEVLGIGAGALWYGLIDRAFGTPDDLVQRIPVWFFLALSGLLEGAVLGQLQARALRVIYPKLSTGLWINLTIVLAVIGWGVGAAIPTFVAPALAPAFAEPALGPTLAFAALFGMAVGAAFGAVQMIALRRGASRAFWWIPANMAGWGLGLPIIYAVATTMPDNAPGLAILLAGAGAGLCAGLVVGGVTGAFFRFMPPRGA
jgi:hypothetical protein